MTYYYYERVGEPLFRQLAEWLRAGTSVTLLGQRGGGKRYAMRRVMRILKDPGDSGTVAMLPIAETVSNADALGSLIAEAIGYERKTGAIFDAVDRHWFEHRQPITLLVPNLDALRHEIVQLFLQGLRVRVEDRQVIVLLGGDQNFREFVYGPNSEFNCTTQVMLQGFDNVEFSMLVDQYRKLLLFDITDGARESLWEIGGGNPLLLRSIVARAVERRAREPRAGDGSLTADEVRELLGPLSVSSTTSRRLFGQAIETITHSPGCRFVLENLLNTGLQYEPLADAPLEPDALELAGVAIREGCFLRFGSRVAEGFFKDHFTPRRLADLYGHAGDWNEAFRRYRQLGESQWLRPDSAADRNEVDRVLRLLAGHIAGAATEIRAYLPFRNAIRCILGFTEFSWWRWNRGWELDSTRTVGPANDPESAPANPFPAEQAYKFSQALPRNPANTSGWIDLPEPWCRLVVAVAVEIPGGGYPEILALGDVALNRSISQDRLRMVRALVDAFLPAFDRARQAAFLKRDLALHEQRMAVLDSILETVADLDVDRIAVCRRVAQSMRKLGYRRVLICLLDPKRQRIKGVWDDSDQPHVNVARMTDYELQSVTDVQPVVIALRQPFVTADAKTESLANQGVVAATGLTAFAVVPILDRDGNAVGTIHVEREDERAPSELELGELTRFGERLAIVLAHGERNTFMNEALDLISDPLAIVDPSLRWRYANSPAAKSLGIPYGWRRWGDAKSWGNGQQEKVKEHLERALDSPAREDHVVAEQLEGLCVSEDRYHLLTAPIRDPTRVVVGAVVTLREFTRIQTLVTMVGKIIRAGTVKAALQAVLDSMAALGRDSARVYLIKEQSGEERLVSCLAIGNDAEQLKIFNSGGIVLAPRSPDHHTWTCIERRKGTIFKWDPTGNNGEVVRTPSGLDAEVVTNPDQGPLLGKKPGDYWIDLPLIAGDGRTLGKLATHIAEDLDAQQFWVLQILAALAAVIIETFRTHEQQEEERKRWEETGYQKSLSTVAHHLLNRVIALDGLRFQYKKAETEATDLRTINQDFETLLKLITATVKRTRDFLLPPQPKLRPLELNELCQRILSSQLAAPTVGAEFHSDASCLLICADLELIALSLAEVFDNARKAVAEAPDPKVLVQLEVVDGAAVISVHDNGCGIAENDYEEVFVDFNSAWPNGVRSTGLGLGWVRRVFRAHKGDVKIVPSTFSAGVCFRLTLPLEPEMSYE